MFALILGLGISAIQIIPSIKLFQISEKYSWDLMTRYGYSLPATHLITYFSPYIFGISQTEDNFVFTSFQALESIFEGESQKRVCNFTFFFNSSLLLEKAEF